MVTPGVARAVEGGGARAAEGGGARAAEGGGAPLEGLPYHEIWIDQESFGSDMHLRVYPLIEERTGARIPTEPKVSIRQNTVEITVTLAPDTAPGHYRAAVCNRDKPDDRPITYLRLYIPKPLEE